MQSDNRFYVTTPIYYVNAKPHVGTTYTTVIADVAARFARFSGREALLVTGSDEHSQNIADLAAQSGKTPLQFCDDIVPSFNEMWQRAAIQDFRFVRTSDARHVELVQRFWQRIYDRGDVYKGEYSGWYHTSDNRFLDESEVPEHPDTHPRLKFLTEEAYYFRLSRYQDWLLAFHEANPTFVIPDFRRNEMLNRIRGGLKDICISRTSTDWGVQLPWDSGHVLYVWVDALLAYITGSGFDLDAWEREAGQDSEPSRDSASEVWDLQRPLPGQPAGNYWPCDLHIMAVDIPWFHAIIFPAMLRSFGAPLPRQMLVHGYWNFGGEKMSKSLGNVVDPYEAMELVGVDGLRYFLLREVPLGADGAFSHEALVNRFNYDLANDLGNLVHRTVSMLHQLFDGVVPDELGISDLDDAIEGKRRETIDAVTADYAAMRYSEALQGIWALIGEANRYIDDKKPWELKKRPERRDEISTVFHRLIQVIRTVLLLAYPAIPTGANEMWQTLGLEGPLEELRADALRQAVPAGHRVNASVPLYQRIDTKKLSNDDGRAGVPARQSEAAGRSPGPGGMTSTAAGPTEEAGRSAGATGDASTESRPTEGVITIDDFARVELRVGEVRSADRIENADKLLRLSVFDGERERTVLAGIAQWYTPDELVGRQVVLVANLAPRKMRGFISEGMLLAAGGEGDSLGLIMPDRPVSAGSRVK